MAQLAEQRIVSGGVIDYFGMSDVVPPVTDWPGAVIAVNVGAAVIPTAMSLSLLARRRLWGIGLVGTAGVAIVRYLLAEPIPGLGIVLPIFGPILATVVVMLLSRQAAASLASIRGSLGTLIGADLLNFDKLQGLAARIASLSRAPDKASPRPG